MARAGSDSADAQEAFRVFHARHFDYLCEVVARSQLAPALGGDRGVLDLVDDVFAHVSRCADEFELECEERGDDRARVRAWLGRLAAETALERAQRREDPAAAAPPAAGDALEALRSADDASVSALLALDESAREPILAALAFYDPAAGLSRVPGWVLDELAERRGTTRAGLRRDRDRLLDELAQAPAPVVPRETVRGRWKPEEA